MAQIEHDGVESCCALEALSVIKPQNSSNAVIVHRAGFGGAAAATGSTTSGAAEFIGDREIAADATCGALDRNRSAAWPVSSVSPSGQNRATGVGTGENVLVSCETLAISTRIVQYPCSDA